MDIISKNIKFLRNVKGYTQEQLAEKLGIKRSLLGAYEEARADPRLNTLLKLSDQFHTTVDILISKDLSKLSEDEWNKLKSPFKQVLAITVNEEGKENIELVPHKAAAGYVSGYSDPEFIRELPKFKLPILPQNKSYRAFEITGESMLPILPGTIVIGEFVESLTEIKNGKTYIVITKDDGIIYKRVFNYLEENGNLFLVSDNRQYSPYQIKGEDIVEAWAARAFISVNFPDVESTSEVSVEQLATIVLDLQKEVTKLRKEN